jgi:hypothetical protein
VLRRWNRHEDAVSLWTDEDSALADLAEHIRGNWDNVLGREGIPNHPPTDDREAIGLYYGPAEERGDEDYALWAEDIGSRPARRDYRFPSQEACEQANLNAVLHPQTHPGDADLPCLEVCGILTFTYLDHHAGAVRVSVHLESAEPGLVRPDGTVPLRVEVGDTVIFDDSATDSLRARTGLGRKNSASTPSQPAA